MITEVDLSWFAAIVDIKGKTTIKTSKARVTPQVVLWVQARNEAIIKRLCSLTGRDPEIVRHKAASERFRRGCVAHCPEAHIHEDFSKMPVTYKWSATGSAAAIIIFNLMPHLTDQVMYTDLMTEILGNIPLYGRGSEAVKQSAKTLNDLGWRLPRLIMDAVTSL